jgi:cell division protein FtsA
MHVPFELAEAVKVQRGHALARAVDPLEVFLVEPFGDGMPIEVGRSQLAEVIEARVEEIFEMAQKEIKRSGYDGLLRAGAVVTGGGCALPGTKEVAQRVLGVPIRIARPERLTGMADALRNPAYSTSVGLLRMGLQMETVVPVETNGGVVRPPALKLGQMFGSLFRRLLPDEE